MKINMDISRPIIFRRVSSVDDARRIFRHQIHSWRTLSRRISPETAASSIKLRGGRTPSTKSVSTKIHKQSDFTYNSLVLVNSQLVALDNLISQLQISFKGDKNATNLIKAAQGFREKVLEKYKKIETNLAKQTSQEVSPKFKTMFDQVKRYVEERLKGRFEESSIRTLAATVEGERHLVGYLLLKGLMGSDNFRYSEFYFILTQVTDVSGNVKYYISLTQHWALPGKYSFDAQGDNFPQLQKLINDQLVVDGFMDKIMPRKLAIPKENVQFIHNSIQKVDVKEDRIIITLKNRVNATLVRDDLKIQLISMIRNVSPRNRDVIRDKIETRGGVTKITFIFTLPGNLRSKVLSTNRIDELKKLLNLSTKQVQILKDHMSKE